MMVDEQIQSYRISLSWQNQTTPICFVGTMKLIISFLCQLRLDPELMERMHMNVWHQRRTANHNTEQVWFTSRERASEIQNSLLKVHHMRNFKHISTEVLVHERGQIKEIILLYQCSHKWNLWS